MQSQWQVICVSRNHAGTVEARAANAEHEVVVQLPDDGGQSVGGEIIVRLLEVSAADEPPEGRER